VKRGGRVSAGVVDDVFGSTTVAAGNDHDDAQDSVRCKTMQ
jgi:hypothetical protein